MPHELEKQPDVDVIATDGATLRTELAAFLDANSKYFSDRDMSEAAQEFFRCHDVAHVVFGCGTSIVGEGTVKVWSIFGTTLGFRDHLRGYAEADAFELFRQYSWSHVARSMARVMRDAPRAIVRARRMHARWPWATHDDYLDVPLAQIRAEFGIAPIEPS